MQLSNTVPSSSSGAPAGFAVETSAHVNRVHRQSEGGMSRSQKKEMTDESREGKGGIDSVSKKVWLFKVTPPFF